MLTITFTQTALIVVAIWGLVLCLFARMLIRQRPAPSPIIDNQSLQFEYLSKRIETIETEEQYYDMLGSIKTFEILFGESAYGEILKDQLELQMGWSRVGELCMN